LLLARAWRPARARDHAQRRHRRLNQRLQVRRRKVDGGGDLRARGGEKRRAQTHGERGKARQRAAARVSGKCGRHAAERARARERVRRRRRRRRRRLERTHRLEVLDGQRAGGLEALGNFDGVQALHQQQLGLLQQRAREHDDARGAVADLVVLAGRQLDNQPRNLVLHLHLCQDRRAVVGDRHVAVGRDEHLVHA